MSSDQEAAAPIFDPDPPPPRWREGIAIVLVVLVSDLLIYRGHGFSGYAAFFVIAPILLRLGSPDPRRGRMTLCVGLLLAVLAVRLAWLGSVLHVVAGFALLTAFAMSVAGLTPHCIEVVLFATETLVSGYAGLKFYSNSLEQRRTTSAKRSSLSIILPLIAFVVFGGLFVLANPDLLKTFSDRIGQTFAELRDWLFEFAPDFGEFVFCGAALWITIGLLRPILKQRLLGGEHVSHDDAAAEQTETYLYSPYRNTLVTVIVLFAIYLGFEFATLWFREFPQGFHYSGYAHEGAAWLTVALALATVVLSLIFRGTTLRDPRLPRLKRLAWVWSFENLLLAISVYNRLGIYIGFNGLTPARILGFFGMTAVVLGFLMVLFKIKQHRSFGWLLQRHLWALALMVFVWLLTPVDLLVVRYNTVRILVGDPAPAVQISVQGIDSQGVLELLPLLECEDTIIREGVGALLSERIEQAEARESERQELGWTSRQLADRRALEGLRANQARWEEFRDVGRREEALSRFHEYVYQWF